MDLAIREEEEGATVATFLAREILVAVGGKIIELYTVEVIQQATLALILVVYCATARTFKYRRAVLFSFPFSFYCFL